MWPASEPDVRQRLVTLADGGHVRVVERGPADAPPVVLVHGWCCSAFTWRYLLAPLAAQGLRAVALDLRGHGRSDKPLDPALYTLPALGRHLLDALDALGIDRAVLVGHSMGGAVAVRAALDAPARVDGLVLVAPVAFGPLPLMRLVRYLTPRAVDPAIGRLSRARAARLLVAAVLRLAHGGVRADPRAVAEYWAPTRAPEFARAMRLVAHAFDWSPGNPAQLARVRAATEVLFGTRDVLVRARGAERYVRCIPGVHLEMVRGGGHVLPEDAPEAVAAAVRRITERLPARPGNGASHKQDNGLD